MIVVAPATAAADDRYGLSALDRTGVDCRADPGGEAAAQQTHRGVLFALERGFDEGALPGRDQRLLRERTDPQCGFEFCAVLEGHLLLGIVGVEAVPRFTAAARPAFAAHRAPVEDHVIAHGHLRDTLAHGADHACGLVPQEIGEGVPHAAHLVVQVRLTHPAREHVHECLARPRIGDQDGFNGGGLVLGPHHHAFDLVHTVASVVS